LLYKKLNVINDKIKYIIKFLFLTMELIIDCIKQFT